MARTGCRTSFVFTGHQLLFIHNTGLVLSHRLKRIGNKREFTPLAARPGHHWPGGYNDTWDIQARCSHEHARGDFVAVGQKDQTIKAMGLGNRLNHIGNQFAGRQRIVHAAMAHGDAVANSGDAEDKGMTTTCVYTFFDEALEITHPGVTRDQVGKGRSNPDKRFVHLLLWNTSSF